MLKNRQLRYFALNAIQSPIFQDFFWYLSRPMDALSGRIFADKNPMKSITISFFMSVFFLTHLAWGFDSLYCDGKLGDWVVTLDDAKKTEALNPKNQNVKLSEKVSGTLLIKSSKDKIVVTIFPWNSLYVRIPKETKAAYDVKSEEVANGFIIKITDKKARDLRSLNCRFTF